MNRSTMKSVTSALIGGACLLAATSSWGATFDLVAESFTKNVNSRPVHMWGFRLDSDTTPSSPGPALVITDPTDTVLTIKLQNNLAVPISLVIPNQNGYARAATEPVKFTPAGDTRERARSFVKETAPGATVTYVWNNVTPGTYLYYSGTHSALQVQMGLYGMLKKDAAAGQAYAGHTYSSEQVWIFGEIDFEVHDAVQAGTYAATIKSMIHSVPEVYLLNGEPFTVGDLSLTGGQATLVRMLNACYDERIPVVNGRHLTLIAEDGRAYPYAKVENAVNLPALKTRDVLVTPTASAEEKFYDRRLLSMQ
jgi:FtsP/CotA-like multicopper oxidase with cupredoxin domain